MLVRLVCRGWKYYDIYNMGRDVSQFIYHLYKTNKKQYYFLHLYLFPPCPGDRGWEEPRPSFKTEAAERRYRSDGTTILDRGGIREGPDPIIVQYH